MCLSEVVNLSSEGRMRETVFVFTPRPNIFRTLQLISDGAYGKQAARLTANAVVLFDLSSFELYSSSATNSLETKARLTTIVVLIFGPASFHS